MILVMRAVVIAAVAIVLSAPASAQTANSLPGQPQVMTKISASDVMAMMTELTVTSQMMQQENGSPMVLATTPSGGRFLFHFLGCENAAEAKNCANTVVTAALPGAGYAYDDINRFNGSAVVTTGVQVPQQPIIILGRNIVVLGGHSRELFKGTVYLFLVDVQKFVDMKPTANTIAFSPTPDKASKISGGAAGEVSGEAANVFGLNDLSAHVSAAIANTSGVDFSVDYKIER